MSKHVARAPWAIATYAKMSPPVQEFARKLYAVRNDRQLVAATFDAEKPPNAVFTLWEVNALADVVRYLPEGWTP